MRHFFGPVQLRQKKKEVSTYCRFPQNFNSTLQKV
uniref:Uncharacterized protein n=1 Tax=Rhizophora mucronata TaxID=61149 RepID=A0A2P2J013_RHIMU